MLGAMNISTMKFQVAMTSLMSDYMVPVQGVFQDQIETYVHSVWQPLNVFD
jgi:hypothetical protein